MSIGTTLVGFAVGVWAGNAIQRSHKAATSPEQPGLDTGAGEAVNVPQKPICNCMVVWDEFARFDPATNMFTGDHVWINGSFDGSCGHPATGTPYTPPEQDEVR